MIICKVSGEKDSYSVVYSITVLVHCFVSVLLECCCLQHNVFVFHVVFFLCSQESSAAEEKLGLVDNDDGNAEANGDDNDSDESDEESGEGEDNASDDVEMEDENASAESSDAESADEEDGKC